MTAKRIFYAMIACVAIIAILVGAAVFGANSFLNGQKDKLVQAKVENRIVEKQQQYLVQAKQDIETYKELNKITKTIVPQDKDQAKTAREISAIASKSGIQLDSITFPVSSLGGAAAPTPSGNNSSSSSSSSNAPPSGLTQVQPVEGISGVYALEVVVTSQSAVSYQQFLDFLERLESNRRTAHVQNLTLTPNDIGDSLSFTLTLNAYLKP